MQELFAAGCLGMSERKQLQQSQSVELQGHRIKNYKTTTPDVWNHHNSSQDPDIASTQAGKPVSNARTHPRAALKDKHPRATLKDTRPSGGSQDSNKTPWHGSNHVHNHVASKAAESKSHDQTQAAESNKSRDSGRTNGKRRQSAEGEEEVWTEHVSSSGRTYYYNKRLDKSQWDRTPLPALKKVKCDSTPSGHRVSNTSASTPAASGHRTSSTPASTPAASGHRTSASTPGASGHRNRTTPASTAAGHRTSTPASSHGKVSHHTKTSHHEDPNKGAGHRDGGRSAKQGHHGNKHESRPHQRKSRSHSGSSTPPGGRQHGTNRPPSGRSHVNQHTGLERPRKTHNTGSPGSTPKGSGIQLISPTTPGNHSTFVTPGSHSTFVTPGSHSTLVTPALSTSLSQTLSSFIDHTSILLEQQQKLLARETTPTPVLTTPTVANQIHFNSVPATPPTHHTQPMAKKKLALTPHQILSPSYSTTHSPLPQPGAMFSGTVMSSPQAVVDSSGLHPLQRALLLHNQKIQQTPPTAIPHHMTSQHSIPGTPLLSSPSVGGPAYSMPQPGTPLQQNMFIMPGGGLPVGFEPAGVAPQAVVLSSKVLQKPVSRLAYLNNSSELLHFPNTAGLERVAGSQVRPEHVDRNLAGLWLQHNHALARQVEQGRMETHHRRTLESFMLSGQLTKKRLVLAAGDVKIASRTQRCRHVQALMQELDKR